MGLLDWSPPSEDDMFPNFDIGLRISDPIAEEPVSNGSETSLSTATSTSTSSSQDSSRSSSPSGTSPPPSTPSRPQLSLHIPSAYHSRKHTKVAPQIRPRPQPRRSTTTPVIGSARPTLKKRNPSFDLFGDDKELQEAEATISFCDICLKHCDVH